MKLSAAIVAIVPGTVQAGGHVFRASNEYGSIAIVSGSPLQASGGGGGAGGGGGLRSRRARADEEVQLTVPEYSDETCAGWLSNVFAADADGSNGLSSDEFTEFLKGVDNDLLRAYFEENPSDEYEDLPWYFKVAHKSLACRCQDLGLGNQCCVGPDAEVPFVGLKDIDDDREVDDDGEVNRQSLTPAQQEVADEYKADICNSVAAAFEEVIPEPKPTGSPTVSPAPTPVTQAPVTPGPTVGEPAATAPPVIVPPSGEVYVCGDPELCKTSVPGPGSSVWSPAGPCGTATETPCPAAYDAGGSDEYGVGTLVSVPTAFDPVFPNGMGLNVPASVIDYSSFDYSTLFSRRELQVPEFYNAQEVMANTDDNNILGDFIKGFNTLGDEVIAGMTSRKRGLRRGNDESRGLQMMSEMILPVKVTDIACPGGTVFAPPSAICLNFMVEFDTDADPEGTYDLINVVDEISAAINEGDLYKIIKRDYPDTYITGLGNPGEGVRYDGSVPTAPEEVDPDDDNTDVDGDRVVDGTEEVEEESDGLGSAAIVGIIIAVVAVPLLAVATFSRYNQVKEEERRSAYEEYMNKQASKKDLEGGLGGENLNPNAAAALVAGGAAGAVVLSDSSKRVPRDPSESVMETKPRSKEDDIAEIRQLVADTNAPKTADELLGQYEGREKELLKNLRKMKSKQEMTAEITSLAAETNAPKSSEELLAAYSGREDELLAHLRTMKSKQDAKAEVTELVERANPGKSAEELLAAYEGREDELVKNLKKMESKKLEESLLAEKQQSVRALVDETNPGKDADELLAAYAGREDELISNLTKMKSKQEMDASLLAEKQASIRALVDETNPGKTADELLEKYEGREDDLIKNLTKMKSKKISGSTKKAKKEQIERLVRETSPGKTAEELMDAYDGKEDELIKNLTKMKSKKDAQAVEAENKAKAVENVDLGALADEVVAGVDADIKKASLRKEVKSLVAETNPGKTAEELLEAYEGKEEELVKHLQKLKARSSA